MDGSRFVLLDFVGYVMVWTNEDTILTCSPLRNYFLLENDFQVSVKCQHKIDLEAWVSGSSDQVLYVIACNMVQK